MGRAVFGVTTDDDKVWAFPEGVGAMKKDECTMAFLHGIVGGGATAGSALKIGLTKLARPLPAGARVGDRVYYWSDATAARTCSPAGCS